MAENKYGIILDACVDIDPKYVEENDITVVPMEIEVDGKRYLRYYDDREISHKDFVQLLAEGKIAKTSMINPAQWKQVMVEALKKYDEILVIPFSSGLSGTYSSALSAIELVKEELPDAKISLVDTLSASAKYTNVAFAAVENREKGLTAQENAKFLEDNVQNNFPVWFTVDDLQTLVRGGRLSKVKATVAGILNLKPVLRMNETGHLEKVSAQRGSKKAYKAIIDQIAQTIINPEEQTICISHADNENDAHLIANQLVSNLKVKACSINTMSPVICSHTGPNCIAISWRTIKNN